MLLATLKEKTCAQCGKSFTPRSSFHSVCKASCLLKQINREERQKKAATKAERALDRQKRAEQKPTSKWEAECRAIAQALARIRDKDDGCISCHMGANYGGVWHGSHFRSHAAASAVQFHLWNIHKACAQCNLFKSGNIAEYRPRLVEKIGQEKVDWLMSQNQIVRHPVDYYIRFKAVMGKRLRRLEKRSRG